MIKKTAELLRVAALLLVMHIPASLANRLIRWRFPAVEQRPAISLLTARDQDGQAFIDVRGMTLGQVRERVATHRQQQPHGRVILVCAIGYCSSQIAAALLCAGFKNVVNLEGGLRALRQLRREVLAYGAQATA